MGIGTAILFVTLAIVVALMIVWAVSKKAQDWVEDRLDNLENELDEAGF